MNPTCPDCGLPAIVAERSTHELRTLGSMSPQTGPLKGAPVQFRCENDHWFLEDGTASGGPITVKETRWPEGLVL